jgi:invasion protein IalB
MVRFPLAEKATPRIPNAKGVFMTKSHHSLKKAVLLAAASFFAAAIFGAPAKAQQQAPVNGWFKDCAKQEDNEICNVQFQSVAGTGQVVTAISLIEVKGKQTLRVARVTVPTGRLLPPGIKLKVDDKKDVSLQYVFCMPQSCTAEVKLDDNLIALLKGGKALVVSSINLQNKANPVNISLEGFTGVFDGEPIKRDELEQRQRELQEELRKKAEEQRKKLQEEQEKAKAGTATAN